MNIDTTMEIDFANLTKEQLINLVQVRGHALRLSQHNDHRLWDMLASKEVKEGSFEAWMDAKDTALADLVTAEEKILAGQPFVLHVN